MKKSTVFLTGSNGFVGSYFIDNYNKKYNGCKTYQSIGIIRGSGEHLGLMDYKRFIGDHLDLCAEKINYHTYCSCGFNKNKKHE